MKKNNITKTKEQVNICFITDNGYVIPTAVALTSLVANKKPKTKYRIFLLMNQVSEFHKAHLKTLESPTVKIEFIDVDVKKYEVFKAKTHVPVTAAIKFDICEVLPVDKVLYLDGDIIVCKDLQDLYNTNITKHLVAAVRDIGGELKLKFNEKCGVDKYFNSGMMLLNLKGLRQGKYSQKFINAKMSHPSWKCMDQDAFNYLLGAYTKGLPVKYNCMLALYTSKFYQYTIPVLNEFYESKYSDFIEMQNDASIIHFAGEKEYRPWNVINGTFVYLWDHYYKLSPYKHIDLQRKLYVEPKVAPTPVKPNAPVTPTTSASAKPATPVKPAVATTNTTQPVKTNKKNKTKFRLLGFITMLSIEGQ